MRGAKAQLMAINLLARPNSVIETMPRNELLSLSKLQAEGTPSETQIVLGWRIDTRRLIVSLPAEKYQRYKASIDEILKGGSRTWQTKKALESIIGKLEHVATIISTARHFMSRLKQALYQATKYRRTRLTFDELEDFKLRQEFLALGHAGIDVNALIPRQPGRIHITGACTSKGMGGYNIRTGRVWRYQWPDKRLGKISINSLEFMATITALMLKLHEAPPGPIDCSLICCDNVSAMGWLQKSNFVNCGDSELNFRLARHLARLLINHRHCIYSQWLAGEQNNIADHLSRDFDMSDNDLTNFLTITYPSQNRQNLKISPIPAEIILALSSIVLHSHVLEAKPSPRLTESEHIGSDTLPIWKKSALMTTFSYANKVSMNGLLSSARSCSQYEKGTTEREKELLKSLKQQAKCMSHLWQRPSFCPATPIQDSTCPATLQKFYSVKHKPTPRPTQSSNNNSVYRSASSNN